MREQLLILDSQLHVKAASESFYGALKVGPDQTLGKRLADLGNGQWNIPALLALLNELPNVDGEFDDVEVEHDFPALGRRTMLVSARRIAAADVQSGMIQLSILDTTAQRHSDAANYSIGSARLWRASVTPSLSPTPKAASHS
jgi:hypothetical protein